MAEDDALRAFVDDPERVGALLGEVRSPTYRPVHLDGALFALRRVLALYDAQARQLAEARDALSLARITPSSTCALCHQPFSERHEGSVMADDDGRHCHPSCWWRARTEAAEAQLAAAHETIAAQDRAATEWAGRCAKLAHEAQSAQDRLTTFDKECAGLLHRQTAQLAKVRALAERWSKTYPTNRDQSDRLARCEDELRAILAERPA